MLGYHRAELPQGNDDCQTPPSFPRTGESDYTYRKADDNRLVRHTNWEPVYKNKKGEGQISDRYPNREPGFRYSDEDNKRLVRHTNSESVLKDREGEGHRSDRFTNKEPAFKYREEENKRLVRHTDWEPVYKYTGEEEFRGERYTNREPIYSYREGEKGRDAGETDLRQANRYSEAREREEATHSNMSNQVFGHLPRYSYPQEKPEPLAGRNIPPRNFRPGSYTPPKFQDSTPRYNYESPRQPLQQFGQTHHHQQQFEQRPQQNQQYPYQYEQRTYRSGRPDLGNENYEGYSVPYPQEPIRHRQNYYEPPPEIGYRVKYEPQSGQEMMRAHFLEEGDDDKNDPSTEDGDGPHPGWVLLLRFSKDGEVNVRRALTFAAKHIESDGGRILGLARAHSVRIREGGDSWVTFGGMRYFGGGNWDVQLAPNHNDTTYSVLAIYFPSLTRAIQWFDRDSCFKQKDFPPPYTTDCIALPLNSSVDTKYCKTLVLTEYPRISHPEYFRDKFSIPTQEMMSKRFSATPYVVKATSIPTDDPRQRVARHLRGSWIKRNSIITLSLFGSLNETHRYFTDPEYLKCKEAQDRVSAPTTVVMDLEDWRL